MASEILRREFPAGALVQYFDDGSQVWTLPTGKQISMPLLQLILGDTPATGGGTAIASAGQIPATTGAVRLNPAANVNLVTLQAGAVDGQILCVMNESVFLVTFNTADATSRVLNGAQICIPAGTEVDFFWDANLARWIPMGGDFSVGQTPLTGSSPTLVNGSTIATGFNTSRVQEAGAVTGIIMAAGVFANQEVTVVNESAFSITMAAAGTSNVASGVAAVIASLTSRFFAWNSVTALWY